MKYNNDALLELCRCILPEDPTLEKEVQLSIEKPHSFSSQIRYVLKDWIQDQSIEAEIPWYTLIHGLYQRGLVFELSARTIAETLDKQHAKIFLKFPSVKDHFFFLDAFSVIDTLLTLTSNYLRSNHYTLGELRLSSGISIVTMIHQTVAERCQELVRRSGYSELILYPSHADTQYLDHLCIGEAIYPKQDKTRTLPV
jgi:hypothetical protein